MPEDDDETKPVTQEEPDPPFTKEPPELSKGEFDLQGQKDEAQQPPPAPDTDTVSSPQYRDALQHELDTVKQRSIDRQEWIKEQQWAHEQQRNILSQPLPEMPSFEQVYGQGQPPPQRQAPYGAMAAYAAIALPLAFAFGRKGPAAWGAMSGIAHGLESIKHGYDQRARQSAAVWKAQNDLAIRMGDKKMKYYMDFIKNARMDMNQKMNAIGRTADFFHDRDLAESAEIGDYDKVVTKLHQYDTILSNAKKVRAQHEGDIMKYLASDKEHKEYIAELFRRDPEFRKAVLSRENDKISAAYDKAVERYLWKDFDREYKAREATEEEEKGYATEKGKQHAKQLEKTTSNPLGLNLGDGSSEEENVQLPTDIPD